VQRRILYSMYAHGPGLRHRRGAKPVKSARVVGDVLGRFHPHGDQAAYDALVRMAQDFAQRYPLIDGQGNFGSRDGDGAAAMRYTEARLAQDHQPAAGRDRRGHGRIHPNYDGSTQEPVVLPARLPFALLNGASGIAVGLATEIPSHNLREIADACVALVKNPKLTDEELFALVPGPTTRAAARSSAAPPTSPMRTAPAAARSRCARAGRSRNWRAASGSWWSPNCRRASARRSVLEEIEELTNPKVKAGKKALSQDQVQLKQTVLSVLDAVRDESSKDAPVRLVFEPKTSRIEPAELITTLLAHTSLETSAPINLTMVGLDGRPVQKSLRQMLVEWIEFRQRTIERRSRHRLDKVLDRIHILEGRQLVLLNIDEVIAIIRRRRAQAGADRALQAVRPAGRGHPRNPAAPAGAAGSDQDRAGAEGAARGAGQKLEEILGSPAALRR
jgi:topoisomerase-4 subunit A